MFVLALALAACQCRPFKPIMRDLPKFPAETGHVERMSRGNPFAARQLAQTRPHGIE
jgi:hypothetical protein